MDKRTEDRMEGPEESRKAAQPAIAVGVILISLVVMLVIGIVVLG